MERALKESSKGKDAFMKELLVFRKFLIAQTVEYQS
jgi:hypothetical protein